VVARAPQCFVELERGDADDRGGEDQRGDAAEPEADDGDDGGDDAGDDALGRVGAGREVVAAGLGRAARRRTLERPGARRARGGLGRRVVEIGGTRRCRGRGTGCR
jgi:hypothetical protein